MWPDKNTQAVSSPAITAATYTVAATDFLLLANATTQSQVLTLPPAASVPGQTRIVKKIDNTANTVTLKGNGSETIDGSNTLVLNSQNQAQMVMSNGAVWYVVSAS